MKQDETNEQCAERRRLEDAHPALLEIYAARLHAAMELALAKIAIPERALRVVQKKCSPTKAVEAVNRIKANEMIILSGGIGCGKTVAAAKWVHDYVVSKDVWKKRRICNIDDETIDYGFQFIGNAVWVSSAKLARIDHYDTAALAQYTECERLVINDLGIEYVDTKGFYLSLFNEIVDERYSSMRATVLTTNCSPDEFKERYKGRVVDRVREAGRCIGCGDASLRKSPEETQQRLHL
jgi:DNA replication protein DnaC